MDLRTVLARILCMSDEDKHTVTKERSQTYKSIWGWQGSVCMYIPDKDNGSAVRIFKIRRLLGRWWRDMTKECGGIQYNNTHFLLFCFGVLRPVSPEAYSTGSPDKVVPLRTPSSTISHTNLGLVGIPTKAPEMQNIKDLLSTHSIAYSQTSPGFRYQVEKDFELRRIMEWPILHGTSVCSSMNRQV